MIHVHFRKTSSFLFSFIFSGLVPSYASSLVEGGRADAQLTYTTSQEEIECAGVLLELSRGERSSTSLGADDVDGASYQLSGTTSSLFVESTDANNRGSHSELAKRPRSEEETGQNNSHKHPRLFGDAKIQAARDYYYKSDYPNAVKLWDEIFAEDPEIMSFNDFHCALLTCELGQDYDHALEFCEIRIQHLKQKESDPNYDINHEYRVIYEHMGTFSLNKADYQKAIEYYEEALKYLKQEDPKHGVINEAIYNRKIAEAHFRAGEFDAAAKRYEDFFNLKYKKRTHTDYLRAADAYYEVYKRTRKDKDLQSAIKLFDLGYAKAKQRKVKSPESTVAEYCKNKKAIEKAKKKMTPTGKNSARAEESSALAGESERDFGAYAFDFDPEERLV